ncbi:MAG: hypothetical protein DDT19_02875 [Syntrophomonadaceae bacterium]|nr:hypothetical protein [Bacillota bacterium]
MFWKGKDKKLNEKPIDHATLMTIILLLLLIGTFVTAVGGNAAYDLILGVMGGDTTKEVK